VPADAARYTADLPFAARLLRCEEQWLARLVRALPCETDPERGPLYEYVDLVNAVTFSGSGRTYPELAFRFQVKFATEPERSWYEQRTWRLAVHTPADGSGGTGPYRFAPLDPDAPGVVVHEAVREHASGGESGHELGYELVREQAEDGFAVTVTLDGARLPVHDSLALAAWAAQQGEFARGEVTYQTVAEPLRTDAERAWELGMADCVVASKVLAARLRAAGLEARARRGYLLGLVGSEHAWCELYEDGRWRPLDPVFAFATSGLGTDPRFLDLPAFARACRGGRFNRLVPCLVQDAGPLAHDGARPAPAWAPPAVVIRAAPNPRSPSIPEPRSAGAQGVAHVR
jgi:transglutaminase-like putative cysteine protease